MHLAIPLIISNIAIIGMEVIDTIMAGQASAEDLAGLAIGGNIWLIVEVAMFIQITSYWIIGFPLAYSLGLTNFWGKS